MIHGAKLVPAEAPKSVTILGATGTIGQNTLKLIASDAKNFSVAALTAGENAPLLARQAREFKAKRAVIANPASYNELKEALSGSGIEAAAGEGAVCEAAAMDADLVMSAIVGIAGLKPTLCAIRSGKTIALANKECLVSAGELMTREVKKHNATLLPVDSEHSAIFQLCPPPGLAQQDWWGKVESVTITASGGPFREWTGEQMKNVTPAQAVKHPNWNMGAKISVDSATLMNKGLELIEAYHLFPLSPSQLKVIIHPQSIVHALVATIDGSVLAQMSHPDMITPIAYAMAWPKRMAAPVKKLDFTEIGSLQFFAPDYERFPALKLAESALSAGGSAATVLNAANEAAVNRFLAGKIGFLDIAKTVEKTLAKMENKTLSSIEQVLACDGEARKIAESL